MTVQELYERLQQKVLILDGATGTELYARGMPKDACPPQWVSQHPEALIEIQQAYIAAGSEAVYAFSFGSNRLKREEYGLDVDGYAFNKTLAEISRKAAGSDALVVGGLAPTGKFVEPFGDVPFEEMVEVWKEQARGLVDGGVDLFVIETMIDIQEMRAAVIAIQETCDLPIMASMTFSEDGYTLTGTDPLSALTTLQSLGAHIVGCNCSTGPREMLNVIRQMKPYARAPLLAKPNAGLPQLIDGETKFLMEAHEFASFTEAFIDAGANLFGGCCGTSPEYIRRISPIAKRCTPVAPLQQQLLPAVSSARETVLLTKDVPVRIIGERINPTGKKALQASLKAGKLDEVRRLAAEQKASGAQLLDVNMGMAGIDEEEMMLRAVKLLSANSTLPLVIDSANPEIIEKVLRIYPGRALINSISAEQKKMDRLLQVTAKYGAMFILLPLSDEEIPATAEGRIQIVQRIYERATQLGLTRDDIVIDGLTMTVSSDQQAALETLKFLKWCREDFDTNTVLGLSNVSFGLPQRKWINTAFLAMAIQNGLTLAIANPNEELLMNIKAASDVLAVNDKGSKKYIDRFARVGKEASAAPKKETAIKTVYDCVVSGDSEVIVDLVKKTLDSGNSASDLVNKELIPAINKVGDLYDQKFYFLPQLIASADAMKTAFSYLEPLLLKGEEAQPQKVKVVLATVKGDIHDIGKNIVALMLKNYGFEVIDLGKDVPSEKIIEAAMAENTKLIGLSALMTTTMVEMKAVIQLAREKNLDAKFMVGGAVITQEYADEIQADGYARDSIEAVRVAQRLTGAE